jgi:mono/diheme cytochrome c family protein
LLVAVLLTASLSSPSVAAPVDPATLPAPAARPVAFATDIQPLFAHACLRCHGPERPRSGFRLDDPQQALAGGDRGPAIQPGNSADSPLIHYVTRRIPDLEMPPTGKGEPLTSEEVGLLRAWIDQGAHWTTATGNPAEATPDLAANWWSLRPLTRPAVPPVTLSGARVANPVDAFILARLAANHLNPSPEADRRTLIRRLSFDLLGLPPTPAEVEAFVADDRPDAYEHLVDRLLASPRYGERWARHWLDVVHYGETHGYDKDQPRPNAWPYRDYVIRSFNQDKPYRRFVQEQLAGDVLFPDTRDGFEALGFIAAGPWDLIGHAEVPESKIDGKIARHLDRDDMVATTLQTFNSLTVQCAQCHHHRFDPIAQDDYYRLQAVFAAVDRADQPYDLDRDVARQRRELSKRQTELTTRRQALDDAIRARLGPPLVDLDRRIAALAESSRASEAFGYHSGIEPKPEVPKWVQVDLGQPTALARVVLHPAHDDFNGIGAGFGFPVRFRVELANDEGFTGEVALIGDFTQADHPNPGLASLSVDATGPTARFLRVTATRLAPRQQDFIFALAELAAFTPAGTNAARGAAVAALDSIEAPPRWQKQNLTDGWQPGTNQTDSAELAALRRERDTLRHGALSAEEQATLAGIERDLTAIKLELAALPEPSKAYVAAVYTGSGAFAGTGANGGQPRPIHVLHRGNVQTPGPEVGPGALSCLPGLPARFDLPADHREGERRAALARWLTNLDNPLTWRSIVNRVWQYHFGSGLVETPNDFGRMGALPTHPELLDWLAIEFRDGGQSFKRLHRLLVTSGTYRQRSLDDAAQAALDANNRYLWRANRRKLEAEAVRDALLFVAGRLDGTMGGPSFRDFVVDKPEHSPHYLYALHDPDDPQTHRRSIYRFIVRSQPQPFLTTLDCADPSMQVGRRNESVSPLQALALLNNALVLTLSKHFAARLDQGEGDLLTKVRRAHAEALGRAPTAAEAQALTRYADQYGLTNLCRVLFNLNEFTFVD